MLKPAEIKKRLQDSNLRAVARNADVPYMALYLFVTEQVEEPKYSLIKKLSDYLTEGE